MTDYPDPTDAAERVDPGDADGTGVRNDMLMESAIDARLYAHLMREVYVHADSIIDDGGFPSDVLGDVGDIHRTASELAAWFESFADELERRRENA